MIQTTGTQQSSKPAEGRSMLRRVHVNFPLMVIGAVALAVLAGVAISAQDKYTVKVPGGLAFSEFRGYEGWQAISLSRNERVVAAILGNPAMIAAYQAGIPA